MVDPEFVTKYDSNQDELEEKLLFWVCAAGKNGVTAARCLDKLLGSKRKSNPLSIVRGISDLANTMKTCGIGCYNNKSKTFLALCDAKLDLKTCTVEDLEKIPGIGPKTARCFLIHSRRNQPYAGLDTHLLKYLRDLGYDAPKTTPTGKKYKEIEQVFLKLTKKAKMSVADLDLLIWNVYSGKDTSKESKEFLKSLGD